MAEGSTGPTASPITTRRQYRTSSGRLRVQLGQCECGAQVVRALSEMLAVVQRALEGRRSRRDGQDALPGSIFDSGQLPPSVLPLLRALPESLRWLGQFGGLLPQLPRGEPLSQSGDDRSLSDAAARLVGRVLDQLLMAPVEGVTLMALRGARLRYRVESDPGAAESSIRSRVQDAWRRHLGFPASPTIARA